MDEKTQARYRRRAKAFYKRYFISKPFSDVDRIIFALIRCAPLTASYDSWRDLRCAVVYDQLARKQVEIGKIIGAVECPRVIKSFRPLGQRRMKRITPETIEFLIETARKRHDWPLVAALILGRELGCRPAEMHSIEIRDDGIFFIPSAKKTEDGKRGLDRAVATTREAAQFIRWSIGVLENAPGRYSSKISCIQSRLRCMAQQIWPNRTRHPTLYTLRHQMGSDLKRSGRGRGEIAYLMGHQSTKSVNRYGNSRWASGINRTIKPGVEPDEIDELTREKHEMPPSQSQKPEEPAQEPGGEQEQKSELMNTTREASNEGLNSAPSEPLSQSPEPADDVLTELMPEGTEGALERHEPPEPEEDLLANLDPPVNSDGPKLAG